MKLSLTISGILVALIGSVVITFGFSESCTNEITAKVAPLVPVVIGGIMSWVGRFRMGGISKLGVKK